MSPEIADIIKNASPWEIQQLRAMGMYIPVNWHGRKMEGFDPKNSVGLSRVAKKIAKKYRMKARQKHGQRHGNSSTLAA